MNIKQKKIRGNIFCFSIKNTLVTLVVLASVTMLSFMLHLIDDNNIKNDMYVPMLFVMAVFLISRYTEGYFYGIFGSIAGVVLVNFIFTYPYFELNFTISGYPITFISMFVTSVMTSTMTTQIKKQEELKIEAEKEKMRSNLLRSVSHDLRTPLTSIVGTTSALIDNDGKISHEQQLVLLKESHDDAEWLVRMVENLLSITRMNGKEAKINKHTEAAEEIVSEAVSKFNKHFPNVKIKVSVPSELLMVPMDALLIEQVLINLLENSLVHGKNESGITLNVTSDKNKAVFSVSDCGVGISEKAFEHLFDGYLQESDNSESDKKRNMGIGLSVCMSIVKAHGGDMNAENKKSGGTLFEFWIPLKEE